MPDDDGDGHRSVLKKGATLRPDGVQYDRLAVLLLDVVKRQEARIAALESSLNPKPASEDDETRPS